jgi:hypothetical protein
MILTNKLLVSGGSLVPRPNDADLTFTFNALDLPEIRQNSFTRIRTMISIPLTDESTGHVIQPLDSVRQEAGVQLGHISLQSVYTTMRIRHFLHPSHLLINPSIPPGKQDTPPQYPPRPDTSSP